MKILQTGKLPEPEKPWWIGQKTSCSHCKTQVEFEKGDNVQESANRGLSGKRWIVFNCPFCDTQNTYTEIIYR